MAICKRGRAGSKLSGKKQSRQPDMTEKGAKPQGFARMTRPSGIPAVCALMVVQRRPVRHMMR